MTDEKERYNRLVSTYNDLAEKYKGMIELVKDLIEDNDKFQDDVVEEFEKIQSEMRLHRKLLLDLNQRIVGTGEVPG